MKTLTCQIIRLTVGFLLCLVLPHNLRLYGQDTLPAPEKPLRDHPRTSRTLIFCGDQNYPPYEFLNSHGQPEGFTIDIAHAIAKAMQLDIEIQLGPWNQVRSRLENGEIDAITGMFYSPARDERVDFSTPHFITSYAIFVRNSSPIQTLDDLHNKTLLTQDRDLGHDYILENNITKSIITFKDWTHVLDHLANGDGDAALLSRLQGINYLQENDIDNIKIVGPKILQQKYCIAVRQGDSQLLSQINEGLAIIKATGEYDKIYQKWFGVLDKKHFHWVDIIHYAMWIIIPLILLTVAAAGWFWSLKRQVAHKTLELRNEIHHHHNALKSLRESREELNSLFKAAPGGIGVVHQRVIKKINDRFCSMVHYSREELIEKNVRMLYPSRNEYDRVGTILYDQVKKNGIGTIETKWRCKNGNMIDVILSASPLDCQNWELGITFTAFDITQRKSMEQKLQIANDAIEYSSDIVLWVCRDGTIAFANAQACQSLQQSQDELKTQYIWNIDQQSSPEIWAELWKHLNDQKHDIQETRYCTKTDIQIPVEVNYNYIVYGNLEYLFCFARDISERKNIESILRQRIDSLTQPISDVRDLKLQDLFDLNEIQKIQDAFAQATGVASLITDTEGNPITKPSNFCYLCQELIRKNPAGLQNCMNSHAQLGNAANGNFAARPCDGCGLWDGAAGIYVGEKHIANWLIGQVRDQNQSDINISAFAKKLGLDQKKIRQAFEQVTVMSEEQFKKVCHCLYLTARQLSDLAFQNIGQARAIHDIQNAQQKIRQLNEELEKRVNRRTEQLEAANKELEAFAYSVSHDLRTPLRGIDGFSQILIEDYSSNLEPQAQDYLQRIRTGSQKLGHLIDDILQLSRLTRSQIDIQTVNLSHLASEIVSELQQQQPDRNVQWLIQPDMTVAGDPNLLHVVLDNLLGNAWKFTSKKENTIIEFGCDNTIEEPVYFVRDNGAGFDMTYADKIFGAFQRLHSDTEFPGTGIGLATVQRVIHRHGGDVWAQSKIDQGTTFYFTLNQS